LNMYADITDSVRLYLVSVNDIVGERMGGFGFGTVANFQYQIGPYTYSTENAIEPIIDLAGKLYFVGEAYRLGLFDDDLMAAFDARFPYRNIDSALDSHPLESKTFEREFLYQ
ncbi:MAG: hypothetical protein J5736_05170, partial [Bacilli bacterium]|nr:hypothetical protein [Bacilli bacterium]